MEKEIYMKTKSRLKEFMGIDFPELNLVEIELFLSLCLRAK